MDATEKMIKEKLNPFVLSGYLERTGWSFVERKRKDVHVYQLQKSEDDFVQVTIPLDEELADYCEAMCLAVKTIACAENKTVEEFLNIHTDQLFQIKQEMASLGWDIEEKFSKKGWRDRTGYTIWFKRSDWHGKLTYSLTGHQVVFVGTTENAFAYDSVIKTARNTAEKAKKAWEDFPDSIPFQNAKGEILEDVMFYPFSDGKNIFDLKKTNADKIRSMTDEELAEFLRTTATEEGGNLFSCDQYIDTTVCKEHPCCKCGVYLEWLQEEAEG